MTTSLKQILLKTLCKIYSQKSLLPISSCTCGTTSATSTKPSMTSWFTVGTRAAGLNKCFFNLETRSFTFSEQLMTQLLFGTKESQKEKEQMKLSRNGLILPSRLESQWLRFCKISPAFIQSHKKKGFEFTLKLINNNRITFNFLIC